MKASTLRIGRQGTLRVRAGGSERLLGKGRSGTLLVHGRNRGRETTGGRRGLVRGQSFTRHCIVSSASYMVVGISLRMYQRTRWRSILPTPPLRRRIRWAIGGNHESACLRQLGKGSVGQSSSSPAKIWRVVRFARRLGVRTVVECRGSSNRLWRLHLAHSSLNLSHRCAPGCVFFRALGS